MRKINHMESSIVMKMSNKIENMLIQKNTQVLGNRNKRINERKMTIIMN